MSDALWVVRCGQVTYDDATAAQLRLGSAREAGEIPDVLLLLEHFSVYTQGRRGDPAELPMGAPWYEMQGIQVRETDRGGRATYHGIGQLVAYPVVSLKPFGDDVHEYVRRMERVMIAALADSGVGAGVIDGLTGVWTAGGSAPEGDAEALGDAVARGEVRKIGSIGVHVRRGVTSHGLAVNVCNDLQPFEWIVPCGIDGCRMTSISRERGCEQPVAAFADAIAARFAEIYERSAEPVSPADLDDRVGGLEALARGAAASALP